MLRLAVVQVLFNSLFLSEDNVNAIVSMLRSGGSRRGDTSNPRACNDSDDGDGLDGSDSLHRFYTTRPMMEAFIRVFLPYCSELVQQISHSDEIQQRQHHEKEAKHTLHTLQRTNLRARAASLLVDKGNVSQVSMVSVCAYVCKHVYVTVYFLEGSWKRAISFFTITSFVINMVNGDFA